MAYKLGNTRKGWSLVLLLLVMGSFLAVFPLIQMHEETRANSVTASERWAQWQLSKESHLVLAARQNLLSSTDSFTIPGGSFEVATTIEIAADSQFKSSSTSQAHGQPSGFYDGISWYGKTGHAGGDFAGGDGTELNPFQISNAEELNKVRNYLDEEKYFIIVNSIDLSPAQWSDGEGWVPVGNAAKPFIGNISAQWDPVGERYYPVDNLKINRNSTDAGPQGLFGVANNGSISNLVLTNVAVKGGTNTVCTGALVGQAYDLTIQGVDVSGKVEAAYNVGGIVGCLTESQISISTSTAEIAGLNIIGGIAGQTEKSVFTQCVNQGEVKGYQNIGGITGKILESESSLSRCANEGNVVCISEYGGGLVGEGIGTVNVSDCYNSGAVSVGSKYCGGGVGALKGPGAIISNFSNSGLVGKSAIYTGGGVGYGEKITIENSSNSGSLINTVNSSAITHEGGIAGYLIESEVRDCFNNGSVTTGRKYAGGIVGETHKTTVQKCKNSGSVHGSDHAGGISGRTTNGSSTKYCENDGSVSVNSSYCGGITGVNYGANIENCKNHGNITGGYATGGILGLNTRYSTIEAVLKTSFNTGIVRGNSYTGGVVGYNSGTVTSCYWDLTTSQISSSAGGLGRKTALMKRKNTYLKWDFYDIWDIVETQSYPFFR